MDKLARTLGKQFLHLELPELRPHHVWAGRGTGGFCDVCHEIVGAHDVQYEFRSLQLRTQILRMHLACYEAWQSTAIERAQCAQQHAQVRSAAQRACHDFLRCDLELGHALLDVAGGSGGAERIAQLRGRARTICDTVGRCIEHVRPDATRASLAAALTALRERLARARPAP